MKLNLYDICKTAIQNDSGLETRSLHSKVIGTMSRRNFRRLIFHVKSKGITSDRKGHIVTILFPHIKISSLKKNKNLKPINQRVRLWCTCPAFSYFGSSYNSTNLNYNLPNNSEHRVPDVRDPNRKHLICKHCYAVYKDIKDATFIRLYWRFIKTFHRKKKKKSEFDSALNLFLYEYLTTKLNYSSNDAISLILKLNENYLDLDNFLKDHKLII